MESLPREVWSARRSAHRVRVRPWVRDRVERSQHGRKHPVYDFLFEYYSARPAHLERWSPGWGVLLEGATVTDWGEWFEACPDGMILRAERFKSHRLTFLNWACAYQQAILDREAQFGCFGLHEWAMVYRTDRVRHSQYPLRVSDEEIAAVVEMQPLRCTHYDAFRFFTPDAVPRNRIALTRATTIDHDQGGCIHANMDLYRFAYAIAPFVPSELTADCFELAAAAREVDMRASPYDLRSLGFDPIPIETKSGREQYVHEQRLIADRARPLRERILNAYRRLQTAVGRSSPVEESFSEQNAVSRE